MTPRDHRELASDRGFPLLVRHPFPPLPLQDHCRGSKEAVILMPALLVKNTIMSHHEMCQHEGGRMLQAGMHFRPQGRASILLMSVRHNAPYQDRIEDSGRAIIYEGHDVRRDQTTLDPKSVDQPDETPHGTLTQNGKFHQAAQHHKLSGSTPEIVRVYQKIMDGVWVYNGAFRLVDSWKELVGKRHVFKFRLEQADESDFHRLDETELPHSRVIPSAVKVAVYRRDKGKCVLCNATDNLHFDHDYPFSKGGTSIMVENVRLLCARHNLQKSDKIE